MTTSVVRRARRWLPGLLALVAAGAIAGPANAGSAVAGPEAGSSAVGPTAAVTLIPPDPPSAAQCDEAPALGTPVAPGTVRIMAVGDVMLARSIGKAIRQRGPGVVFAGVQDVLSDADILVVNLETSLGTGGKPEDKHYTFRAPPAAADALARAGVDIAGQANNHALDYGPQVLAQGRQLLTDRGIAVVGAGPDARVAHRPVVLTRNGLRIAFLAYVAPFAESTGFNTRSWKAGRHTPGLAIGRPKGIRADVRAALAVADQVVVLIHAGYEEVPTPSGVQRDLARAAIEAGATLVIGAHPHILQGYRREGSTLIAYSLGNFVFDKMPGALADSAILDVRLGSSGVTSVAWIPVVLRHSLPVLAHGDDATRILRRIRPL